MEFVNFLIGHGKIYGCKIAIIELDSTKGHMTNFSFFKITMIEGAVNKYGSYEVALGKITMVENTVFVFVVTDFVL